MFGLAERFKSLGSKRKELSDDHIAETTRLFGEATEVYIDPETGKSPFAPRKNAKNGDANFRGAKGDNLRPISRIFTTTDFGYQTITVERPARTVEWPARDVDGKIVKETKGKRKGKPKPDSSLRDSEDVPLGEDCEEYFQRVVLPHVPDAWIDHDKTKIGYEIPFNCHFTCSNRPASWTRSTRN